MCRKHCKWDVWGGEGGKASICSNVLLCMLDFVFISCTNCILFIRFVEIVFVFRPVCSTIVVSLSCPALFAIDLLCLCALWTK